MTTNQKHYSQKLMASLMYEITAEDIYKDFSSDKEMFRFSNYLSKPKYYVNSSKLVIGKIR